MVEQHGIIRKIKYIYFCMRPSLVRLSIAAVALCATMAYTAYTYKCNTILSDQPEAFRSVFGNEGVLDNSPNSVAFLNRVLVTSTLASLYGSIKLHANFLTNAALQNAFVGNPHLFIGTEDRLSTPETVSGYVPVEDASVTELSRLDRIPALKHRVFSFVDCGNAHVKFFLNRAFLIIGTSNYDRPRTTDGQPYTQWYGKEENSSDFMVTIEREDLINEFAAHLIRYLPPTVKQALTDSFKANGVDLESALYTGAVESPGAKLKAIESGKLVTMFAWGPKDHKALLLDMIKGAKKSISILQQDMQDPDVQAALLEKARDPEIVINICMSKYPFRKPNLNAAKPFFDRLSQVSSKVAVSYVDEDSKDIKHIHSKVMVVDDKYMYLGSANFYPQVLEPTFNHLNVGVITSEKHYLQPVLNQIAKIGALAQGVSSGISR